MIKRVASMVPVLVGLTTAIFLVMRVLPGDAADAMLGDSPTAQNKGELRKSLGLDKPVYAQYGMWVSHAVRGDLGRSFWTNGAVTSEIGNAAPITIELTVIAAALALVIGVTFGVISATKERSFWDYMTRSLSILALAVPNFWLGTLVLVFPAIWWGWIPPTNYTNLWVDPLHNIEQFWLPALVMGASASGGLTRMTRSAMLEVMHQDYIRTARSKGLSGRRVVLTHALKNAMIPVITIFGSLVATLLTGAIVVETIFNLHGFGSLVLESVEQRDYPLIEGCVLIFGIVYTIANLAVDLCYGLLNPRIRYA